MPAAVRIGARDITRRFGAVVANAGVTLEVAPATVHAIVGENGAGKTTLMRILYGLDHPDEGTVVVDDQPVRLGGPADAGARGIGMVHQEFKLVPELTLLENLILGREPTGRGGRIDFARARREAAAVAEEAGTEMEWDLPTERASVPVRQRLEILRLLYRRADVLILDEPTAVLAPQQVGELLRLLRGLRDGGRTVIFISHKLQEVLDLADSITVLRAGRVSGTVAAADASADRLVELMIGERVARVRNDASRQPGPELLSVRGVRARDARGIERLRGVDLDVRAGEIVGIAAVAGNGQDELVDALVGLTRPDTGKIVLRGEEVSRASVADRRGRGLAYIPADRRRDGLSLTSSVQDNAIAGAHRAPELARHGWFRRGATARRAGEIVERHRVRTSGLGTPAGSLSGGNQQRLILGRELARDPRLIVASQPTRGVDVRGAAAIHEQLIALRERGAGVLLISEELDELSALSDRIVVLAGGRVAGEVPAPVEDFAALGRLMTAGAPA